MTNDEYFLRQALRFLPLMVEAEHKEARAELAGWIGKAITAAMPSAPPPVHVPRFDPVRSVGVRA